MLAIAVVAFGIAAYLGWELKRTKFHLVRTQHTLTFEQTELAEWGLRGRRAGIAAFIFAGAMALLWAFDPDGMAGAWRFIGGVVSRLLH